MLVSVLLHTAATVHREATAKSAVEEKNCLPSDEKRFLSVVAALLFSLNH